MVKIKRFFIVFISIVSCSFQLAAQGVGVDVDKFLITAALGANNTNQGERYIFSQGESVYPWIHIRGVSTGVTYQITMEWYNPSGGLFYYDTSPDTRTAPYTYYQSNLFTNATCQSGLWRIDFKIKNLNTGVTSLIGSKTFTLLTCTCVPPAAPTANNVQICSGQSANLIANGCTDGTLTWWNAPTGGTQVGTSASFTTPILTTNTTYYVQCQSGSCASTRTPVSVTIGNLAAPSANNVQICSGQTANLTANGCSGGTLTWWKAANGGTQAGTSASFTTPVLTTNTTYYVQCQSGACTSTRTPVSVTVSNLAAPTANDVQICSGQTANLTANGCSGGTLTWWNAPTGGTQVGTSASFTTPVLTTNATYYVQCQAGTCTSSRTPVAVTVSNLAAPTANNVQICSGQSANLTANGCSNGTLTWWNAPSGGSQVGNGTTFTTPVLTTNATYYVQCQTGSCTSSRTPVSVTIGSLLAPTANNVQICSGQTASLTANGCASGTLTWWNATSGGSQVGNGTTFTTPVLATNATYYVQCQAGSCTSSRTPVSVTIVSLAAPTANNVQICSGQTANLTANGCANGTLTWWNEANGGTQVGTGTTFTTPVLNANITYYVQCQLGSCVTTRTPAMVTVTVGNLGAPTANSVQICSGQTANLTAIGCSSSSLTWWNAISGGTQMGTGTSFTTPQLTSNATYYVQCQSGTCTSPRRLVTVTVGNQPTADAGTAETINCEKPTATLTGKTNTTLATVTWTFPDGQTKTSLSTTTQQGGTHTFTATDIASGCKASSTVFVKLDTERPVISDIGTLAAKSACSLDGSIVITATANSGALPLTYKLDNGIFGNSNTFNGLKGGNYNVTVKGKNFCETSKSVTVAAPLFTAKIKFPSCYYYVGSDVQLMLEQKGGLAPIRYVWSATPSVNFSCPNCLTPKIIIKDTTSLKIRVVATDNAGCTASDTVLFNKIKENKATDVITPNGDGLNDVLTFPDLECGKDPTQFLNNEITIVNRWGELVFKMKNYDNTWSGTNQSGQLLPGGTYFYVLRLNIAQGQVYRGNVLIVP